jgi:hypothetical protein
MRCYSTTVDESVLVGPFRWRTMQANAATANSSSSNSPGLVRAFFFLSRFLRPSTSKAGLQGATWRGMRVRPEVESTGDPVRSR